MFEAKKVVAGELVPIVSGMDLFLPLGSDFGDQAGHASILFPIGHATAPGPSTEAALVITGVMKVMRVQHEIDVGGSVTPYPEIRVRPVILDSMSRPLDMW
jgi:hypothetical protein